MSQLDTDFAVEVADRAVKSFFQGVLAVFAISDAGPVNAFEFDWSAGLGAGLAMTILSVATSLASGSIFKKGATPASTLPPRSSRRRQVQD